MAATKAKPVAKPRDRQAEEVKRLQADLAAMRERFHSSQQRNDKLRFRLQESESAIKAMSRVIASLTGNQLVAHPDDYIPF